jgi:hypothetical protein
MSFLNIRVNMQTNYTNPERGAQLAGNIYSVDDSERSQRDVVLPIGDRVKPARFDVEPGRYVIEAALPSGRLLSHEVKVEAGQTVPVEFDATDSPNPDLSWQYILGNVESADVYHNDDPVPVPNSRSARTASPRLISGQVADQLSLPGVWCSGEADNGIDFEDLLTLAEGEPQWAFDRFTLAQWVDKDGEVWPSIGNHPAAALFAFTSETFPGLSPYRTGGRRFLLVRTEVGRFMVTLPVPWLDLRSREESIVEVLVNGRQSPFGNPVAVAVRDSNVGAGLGYLASGALSRAAVLFGDVEQMLFGKMQNPLSAAAGAYVLVGTELSQVRTQWDDWIDNLDTRFPFMSDGAILRAIRRLRMAQTEDDLQAARKSLLHAAWRGVPIFTLGISWLIDGLSEFGYDHECQEALLRVRRLSWRVDMREAFVIVRLGPSE